MRAIDNVLMYHSRPAHPFRAVITKLSHSPQHNSVILRTTSLFATPRICHSQDQRSLASHQEALILRTPTLYTTTSSDYGSVHSPQDQRSDLSLATKKLSFSGHPLSRHPLSSDQLYSLSTTTSSDYGSVILRTSARSLATKRLSFPLSVTTKFAATTDLSFSGPAPHKLYSSANDLQRLRICHSQDQRSLASKLSFSDTHSPRATKKTHSFSGPALARSHQETLILRTPNLVTTKLHNNDLQRLRICHSQDQLSLASHQETPHSRDTHSSDH
ncbi:unnamed protein product [Acanthosepion pharaonis]|uniref:Uncharacterized protein n=1 Tax=Acanthosepion pharaonis TaxID=158019 RepID=A0A812C8K6_ACAPH|nr:unnamed protein product [Sepia pharaonis]